MTQQQSFRNHPNNPSNQPFNGPGNKTGKKGWWRKGSNNAAKRGSAE